MKQGITRFFRYARARHEIYLKRQAGAPKPWTKDPILSKYRFTNVFRELDKTTVWFRQHVRDVLRDRPEVLLATVLFRLLNRIEVGEAIFSQLNLHLGDADTAWDEYLSNGDIRAIKRGVRACLPRGPYVTGAYIISSPRGYSKLDGVLKIVDTFNKKSGWRHWVDNDPAGNECTLEAAWEFFREQPYFGPFHSYEIVTDLRHTALLDRAPDINSWANPGPGARRGLNRVHGRDVRDKSARRAQLIEEMRELLKLVNTTEKAWPFQWGKWEMREVEHTLCEFDKYERVRLCEGRPRGVYR